MAEHSGLIVMDEGSIEPGGHIPRNIDVARGSTVLKTKFWVETWSPAMTLTLLELILANLPFSGSQKSMLSQEKFLRIKRSSQVCSSPFEYIA